MLNASVRATVRKRVSRQIILLRLFRLQRRFVVSDERYLVRLARTRAEVESALALRYSFFKAEIAGAKPDLETSRLEFDEFDHKCSHLIVIERSTGKTVGTYRILSFEKARSPQGFYSSREFTLADLPNDILTSGMEIGRACIASEHRNTKVLFLMWRALARYLEMTGKRYFFGCCSLFSTDPGTARSAMSQLVAEGHIHETLKVSPLANGVEDLTCNAADGNKTDLPPLFNMYLRIGAKVCGPPTIDHAFGSIDFFVVFDLLKMKSKYRKMFFGI